jgi:ankyrin repeat protein
LRIDPAQASLARAALEFVIFSKRPPTLVELAEAAAVGSYDGPFDIENRLFEPEDILRMCSSLLVLQYPDLNDQETDSEFNSEAPSELDISEFDNPISKSPTVKPAHYTVNEYLRSIRIRSSPAKFFAMSEDSGDASLAKVCLKYLLIFNHPELLGAAVGEEYPLSSYAPEFWVDHITSAVIQHDAIARDLLRRFLDANDYCFLNSIRLSDPDDYDEPHPDLQPSDLLSPIYYLCRAGACCELVKLAIDMGFDVNGPGGTGGSALQAASFWNRDVNMLNILLAAGADVNTLGGRHNTALGSAVARGFEEGVARLLDAGADPNMRQAADDATVLHYAVRLESYHGDGKSSINILHKLLQAGANINALAAYVGSPLAVAARARNMDAIRILLLAGADVNLNASGSRTALSIAAASGDVEIVNFLLDAGADVNAVQGGTAIGAAAAAGNIKMVERLLQAGAEVNLAGTWSAGVLQEAVNSGNVELLNLLLDAGADTNAIRDGTALRAAAEAGNISMAKRLLAEVNLAGTSSAGVLQGAVRSGDIELLNFLLDAGADVNLRDRHGSTALEIAASFGRVWMVQRLLQAGATVNSAGGRGGEALHIAAACGHIDVLIVLLDAGVDVNLRGGGARTAIFRAIRGGHIAAVKLLLQAGAEVNLSAWPGGTHRTPLMIAAREGFIDIVDCILEAGADPNLQPRNEHESGYELNDKLDDELDDESAFDAALKGPRQRDELWWDIAAARTRIAGPHDIIKRLIVAAPMRKDAKRSASERRSGKKAEPRLARRASCNDIVIWEGSSPQSCGTFGEKASNFHEQSRSEV